MIGIDLEDVASLPTAADYHSDAFYLDHFTAAEIAYCLKQANPRRHFAARWCAKEALKKCFPAYTSRAMNELEVIRGEDGQPRLRVWTGGQPAPLPAHLSLTHTGDHALAVVTAERSHSNAVTLPC